MMQEQVIFFKYFVQNFKNLGLKKLYVQVTIKIINGDTITNILVMKINNPHLKILLNLREMVILEV